MTKCSSSRDKGRIQNLDLIRGICILYVVFIHISLSYGLITFKDHGDYTIFNWFSFFMTPFYVFSGYMFSAKRTPREFVKNKYYKLIVPYLFWTVVSLVAYYISQYVRYGIVDFLMPLKSLKSTVAVSANGPLWFFISLFCVTVIYYFVSKYTKLIHPFIFLCFVFAYLVHNRFQLLSWGNITSVY